MNPYYPYIFAVAVQILSAIGFYKIGQLRERDRLQRKARPKAKPSLPEDPWNYQPKRL